MRKRFLSLFLVTLMAGSLLIGCGTSNTDEQSTEVTDETTTEEAAAPTLESIAKLNGVSVDELNILYDDDGYVSFIGNQISDDIISNEDDALALLESMSDTLGLDGVSLTLASTDTSPITGNTYYRFFQTLKGDIATATDIDVKFLSNCIKLAVDSDGYPSAISAYIDHSDLSDVANGKILDWDEAEAEVLAVVPDANIYSDKTIITYWTDTSAQKGDNTGGKMLVYIVYTDAIESSDIDENTADEDALLDDSDDEVAAQLDEINQCSPYNAWLIAATEQEEGQLVGILAADSLEAYSHGSKNTTLSYFDDFEDVGDYTYTVNFDWMRDEDKEYAVEYSGGNSAEVSVPVMKNTKDGLYYLGNKEHYIYMSNYMDFALSGGSTDLLNPYVTDNPEDLSSWHFKISEDSNGTKYYDEPDYVVSSFAKYAEIVSAYGEKFKFFELYPTDSYLLCTYTASSYTEYPTDKSAFDVNAANAGQCFDWTEFQTSPNLGLCLDTATMCHEFTHGVNSHFTDSRYQNEQGAVMEGYADIIGYQMAALLDGTSDSKEWLLGGTYALVIRNLGDPLSMNNPEYKNGLNYVSPINDALMLCRGCDFGGVHTNSGVPNYLAYEMVEGTPESSEAALTMEENLYLWYELLYLSTYNTDFEDVGAYLKYSAKIQNLSEDKVAYMDRLITEHGFDGECQVDAGKLASENPRTITQTLNFDDEDVASTYYLCDLLIPESGSYYMSGGFEDNKTNTTNIAKDDTLVELDLYCQTDPSNTFLNAIIPEGDEDSFTFNVKYLEAEVGEELTVEDAGESVGQLQTADGTTAKTKDGVITINSTAAGNSMLIMQEEDAQKGEYNVYLITYLEPVEEEETAEAETDAE